MKDQISIALINMEDSSKQIEMIHPERYVCSSDYYHCGEKVFRVGKIYWTVYVDRYLVLTCDKDDLYFKKITEKVYFDHFCTEKERRKEKLRRLNGG